MNGWDIFTLTFCSLGVLFFIAGTLGLLRFPDVYSRIHALTKADNLGVGLIVVGLIPQVSDLYQLFKLLIIWVFILISSAISCHLVAQQEFKQRVKKAVLEQPNVN